MYRETKTSPPQSVHRTNKQTENTQQKKVLLTNQVDAYDFFFGTRADEFILGHGLVAHLSLEETAVV
jgi:hypothetical protein